jgi:hypothetical protein
VSPYLYDPDNASGVTVRGRIEPCQASQVSATKLGVFELARVMGASVSMIERHHGTLIGGAHAGIAARLDAQEALAEQASGDV